MVRGSSGGGTGVAVVVRRTGRPVEPAAQNGQGRVAMGSPHQAQAEARMEPAAYASACGWALRATNSTYLPVPQ